MFNSLAKLAPTFYYSKLVNLLLLLYIVWLSNLNMNENVPQHMLTVKQCQNMVLYLCNFSEYFIDFIQLYIASNFIFKVINIHFLPNDVLKTLGFCQSKEEGKDWESKRSNTIPGPGFPIGK